MPPDLNINGDDSHAVFNRSLLMIIKKLFDRIQVLLRIAYWISLFLQENKIDCSWACLRTSVHISFLLPYINHIKSLVKYLSGKRSHDSQKQLYIKYMNETIIPNRKTSTLALYSFLNVAFQRCFSLHFFSRFLFIGCRSNGLVFENPYRCWLC